MTDMLVDWCSFTVKPTALEAEHALQYWQEKLGGGDDWEEGRGGNGYTVGYRCGPMTVLTGGREGMGLHIQLPGQACRHLEATGAVTDWYADLLRPLVKRPASGGPVSAHFSRFDVALDDFAGLINLHDLLRAAHEQRIVSRFSVATPEVQHNLQTGELTAHGLNLGRRGSDSYVRAYDKEIEQNQFVDVDGYNEKVAALEAGWVRVEMQLRNERAQALVEGLCDGTASVPGLLRSYVDVKAEKRDVQRDRWDTDPAWEAFLSGVPARRLSLAPKAASTIQTTAAYLRNQCAPSLAACVDALGVDFAIDLYNNGKARHGEKHERMVKEYARLTGLAQGGQD